MTGESIDRADRGQQSDCDHHIDPGNRHEPLGFRVGDASRANPSPTTRRSSLSRSYSRSADQPDLARIGDYYPFDIRANDYVRLDPRLSGLHAL